jgi:hypothetical protein
MANVRIASLFDHQRRANVENNLVKYHARLEGFLKTLEDDDGYRQRVYPWEQEYDKQVEKDFLEWKNSIQDFVDTDADSKTSLLSRMQEGLESFKERIEESQRANLEISQDAKGKAAFAQYHLYSFLSDWHHTCYKMIEERWQISPSHHWSKLRESHHDQAKHFHQLAQDKAKELDEWQEQRWKLGIQYDSLRRSKNLFTAGIQILNSSSPVQNWKAELLKIGSTMAERHKTQENIKTVLRDNERDRKSICAALAAKNKPIFRQVLEQLKEEIALRISKMKTDESAHRVSVELFKDASSSSLAWLLAYASSTAMLPDHLNPQKHLQELTNEATLQLSKLSPVTQYDLQWLIQHPLTSVRKAAQQAALDVIDYWRLLPFVMQLVAALSMDGLYEVLVTSDLGI